MTPLQTREDEITRYFHQLIIEYERQSGCSAGSGTRDQLMARARSEAPVKAAAEVRRLTLATLAAEEARLRPLLETPDRGRALSMHAEAFARAHAITIVVTPGMPARKMFARTSLRETHIPFIASDLDYAGAMHEHAHNLRPCPKTAPHYRGEQGCLQCEADAWRGAMRAALVWTESMHDEARECMGTYRRSTVGTPEGFRAIDEMSSGATFREEQKRRGRLAWLEKAERTQAVQERWSARRTA